MIASRLRACLKTLRWDAQDLAEILFRERPDIEAWLDGRSRVPLTVAAWLEALVRAHQALPPPLPSGAETPIAVADEVRPLESDEAHPRPLATPGFYLRRNISASPPAIRWAPFTTPVRKGSGNGSHPL